MKNVTQPFAQSSTARTIALTALAAAVLLCGGCPIGNGSYVVCSDGGCKIIEAGDGSTGHDLVADASVGSQMDGTVLIPSDAAIPRDGAIGGGHPHHGDAAMSPADAAMMSSPGDAAVMSTPGAAKAYIGGGYTGEENTAGARSYTAYSGAVEGGATAMMFQWGSGWADAKNQVVGLASGYDGWGGNKMFSAYITGTNATGAFADTIAGNGDAYFDELATQCVNHGIRFIRLAWEFQGNQASGVPPPGSYSAADFVSAWKHVYTVLNAKAVSLGKPNDWFILCWIPNAVNPISGGWNALKAFYPGTPYAQCVGFDTYDARAWGCTAPCSGQNSGWPSENAGIFQNVEPTGNEIRDLAISSGAKFFAMPEYGTRFDDGEPIVNGVITGDDPNFITGSFAFAKDLVQNYNLNVLIMPWGDHWNGTSFTANPPWSPVSPSVPNMTTAFKNAHAAGRAEGWIATTPYPL